MASLLKKKVHEVQDVPHVAGLKQKRYVVELHEEIGVAIGLEDSAKKERRKAMPSVHQLDSGKGYTSARDI
jgi:hypothetical protein